MKIGIAQLNPTIGDIQGNAAKILEAAQFCDSRAVNLMLTPEMALCGYPPRDLLMDESFIDDMAIALEELAHTLPSEIAVLVGTIARNPQASQTGSKALFNSAALLHKGKVQQIFHKRLLPTYDVFDEDRYFTAGLQSSFFTLNDTPSPDRVTESLQVPAEVNSTSLSNSASQQLLTKTTEPQYSLRIGVTICEDIWNDEKFWGKRNYADNPVADLVEQEVDLLVNLSASPYAVGKQNLREAMLQHSALQHNLPLIYANQIGGNDDLIFDGHSVAFNRSGTLIYRGIGFQTDVSVLEFDWQTKDLIASAEAIAALPSCPEAEIWQALVLGVRDYVRKCGFQKTVIGLSGGIDSALVAAIATAALGAENVLGVLMPSPYSSDHSITDALQLAQNLGVKTHILPIEHLMAEYDRSLGDIFAGTQTGITEENLQSRIRGNLLMAISNKFGHLLISTGNKSEMAVGYCTLYGDMNGGLAAIADVPKTKVYAICRWLNEARPVSLLTDAPEIIPSNVITKAPSAELKPGQVDQDSLPPYEVLDDILERLITQHASAHQIIAAGHDAATVERVMQLVKKAEFKRRQAPPGLKITNRAFGSGWRMPIASRRTGKHS